ncbi:uncharacterized protein LOC120267811 [Dioscorea cayenensis subsp. rotundata]|uniref:Uncharacterized protein LOC120267811 n=1 Tax=Dioscorea cayennensis subsp. rotundata TaxID=55577 RepID=A0AB40BVC9_DIOCR|nr:uncharacterized protein LOC120267811 [Dioscorea cayenensis subsp. rotundata]
MDGLQGWAKRKIHRHGAHDLATAISIAELLIELQRDERPKPPKEKGANGNGGGDNHHESKEHKFEKGKWNSKTPNEPKDGGMIQKMKWQDGEEKESPYELKIGSMQIINDLKVQMEKPMESEDRLFVESKVGNHVVDALIDPGATHNFLEEKEAKKLGIPYKMERGMLKSVNMEPTPIHGVARGVKVSLGD